MREVTKALRFPLAGLGRHLSYRDSTYPPEDGAYMTPAASNVVGGCAFSNRERGGSRPGLSVVSVASIAGDRVWLWPNGDRITWPDGDIVAFANADVLAASLGNFSVALMHGTFSVNATKGSAPSSCTAFARYRDRFVVAGGNMLYASRTGDHGDFDYGGDGEDVTRPVALSLALAGREGDNITALMPIGDQRLYVATARGLAVIPGEPTSGMAWISNNVGAISAHAWCDADGTLFFLGANGMYAAGDGAAVLISKQLPEDLKGLSSAVLVYDPEWSGIHILGTGQDHDWFYDISRKAFWPMTYPAAIRPVGGGSVPIDGVNATVFICADGSWRKWNDSATADSDGSPITSSVAIGPFRCGANDFGDGILDTLSMALGEGSANVTIEIYTAKSAEASILAAAAGATPNATLTASEGWNNLQRPRVRGAWATIVLSAAGRWAFEGLAAGIKTTGVLRYG
jgi:hypothetical protein